MSRPASNRHSIDLLTVAALGVIALIVQNVIHEGVGHGGACAWVGGDPVALSTSYFECGYEGVSVTGRKLVAAAGSLANFVAALLFWLALRAGSTSSGTYRLFLWLCLGANLLSGAGYFLFSGALGVGDWAVVIEGLEPVVAWLAAMGVVGALLYLACVGFLLRELAGILDRGDGWHRTAFLVTIVPYIVGSAIATLGSFLNPISPVLILTSAASSFGGVSGLAWMTQMYDVPAVATRVTPTGTGAPMPLTIPRSSIWIGVAVVLALVHVFLLGPSIQL